MEKQEKQKQAEFDPALETTVRDYVRAGWTVMSRTTTSFVLERENAADPQRVRVFLDSGNQVQVDGPPVPMVAFDGRLRVWLTILLLLVASLAASYALGWIRP
jgi:hypothetical protein